MDLRVVATTFAAVFLAEMADKTQLVTFGLAASNASRWSVFVGSALGLVAASALGVLAGGLVGRFVSPALLMRVAGAFFVVVGVWTFLSAGKATEPAGQAPPSESPTVSAPSGTDAG